MFPWRTIHPCHILQQKNQDPIYFSKVLKYGNFCAFLSVFTNHTICYPNKRTLLWITTRFFSVHVGWRRQLYVANHAYWFLTQQLFIVNCRYGFLTPFDSCPWYFWFWTCETDFQPLELQPVIIFMLDLTHDQIILTSNIKILFFLKYTYWSISIKQVWI